MRYAKQDILHFYSFSPYFVGKNTKSRHFFKIVDVLSQRVFKFCVIYFVPTFSISMLSFSVTSVVHSYIVEGYPNPDHLFMPYNVLLPWSQNTFEGYIVTVVLSVYGASVFFFTNSVFLSFFVAVTLYFHACCQYFSQQIVEINNQSGTSAKTLICKLIRHHNFIKK